MEEEDPWNKRISETGCFQENEDLQICRYDKGDWRKCLKEMKAFRDCWEKHKNAQRVSTIDSTKSTESSASDYNLTGETHSR